MAGFSELIKNFEKTRDYVRDFFIYGYKVRNDFDKKSARTYDDEKRRVESWLGDYLVYDDSVRGKQVAISVDSDKIAENPLYQAFYTRSFTDNDIRLHFLLLDIMCDGEQYTARQLTDMLYEGFQFSLDEQTVRNKLKEYEEEGIMLSEKRGRSVFFRLSGDFAEDWLDSEGLIDAVSFFSETQEFGLVGNIVLLVLYLLLIARGLIITLRASTVFSRLLAGAITMMFFMYAFVNMGMVSGILPVVGVPLPFMSYGGTAMVTLGLGAGILMSIHRHRHLVQT